MNEQELIAARNQLRTYRMQHPEWSTNTLATKIGFSRAWVIKWLKRLKDTHPDDLDSVKSHSRKPQTPPKRFDEKVIDTILRLRDDPPEEIQFTPGPRTILTYLHRDEQLKTYALPLSQTTVWKILDTYHRIPRQPTFEHHPFERPAAGDTWEIDFTDAISGAIEPDKRKQHGVEVFNIVDRGSSVWVDTEASGEFDAEQALVTLIDMFSKHGLPNVLVFDNDPRFVGSWTSEGYPSALMRFLLCVGVEASPCRPRKPQEKPFVERLHRSLKSECIRKHRPGTLDDVREKIAEYHHTYNNKRPNQAKVCGNKPPLEAVGKLPIMNYLPSEVDPDKWIERYHNKYFTRQVSPKGTITIGKYTYSVGIACAGQRVTAIVDANTREFRIMTHVGEKRKAIKGLKGGVMKFDHFVDVILEEARSEYRRLAKSRLKKASKVRKV